MRYCVLAREAALSLQLEVVRRPVTRFQASAHSPLNLAHETAAPDFRTLQIRVSHPHEQKHRSDLRLPTLKVGDGYAGHDIPPSCVAGNLVVNAPEDRA